MWSAALNSVGGRGSAFCVLVEKVDEGRGDGGPEEAIVIGRDVVVDTGLRAGSLSEAGTGRRRFKMDEATGIGSCSTMGVCVGRGGGGDGGGEC